MIFQSQQQREDQRQQEKPQFGLGDSDYIQGKNNLFQLTQQQKININKQLPRGFCLVRKQQYDKLTFNKTAHLQYINYEPKKIQKIINIDNPIYKTIEQIWNKKQEENKKSNKPSFQFNIQGRSRQSQKIKNIIQRFRKLIKNTQVESYLNKVGLMLGFNQIQGQNKKGLLTIDTFKARWMLVLETAKVTTFETEVVAHIDEMIQEFMCYVEQARKAQFQNNILSIQKSIDKITRYLSDTADGKAQGNWYIRKKKKPQRNQNYPQKQLLYFGELIKKLPKAYLIGVWQIVNQKPFTECQRKIQKFNLAELNNKKLRQIELYIKGKLSQLYRSSQRKKQKIKLKKKEKQKDKQKDNVKIQKEQEIQQQKINDFDDVFLDYLGKQDQQFVQIFGKQNQQQSKQKQLKKSLNVPTQQSQNEQDQIGALSDSSMLTDQEDSDF